MSRPTLFDIELPTAKENMRDRDNFNSGGAGVAYKESGPMIRATRILVTSSANSHGHRHVKHGKLYQTTGNWRFGRVCCRLLLTRRK